MKVLVCGSRDYKNTSTIWNRMGQLRREVPGHLTVIHGAARGADITAAHFALKFGCDVEAFPAKWKEHGRSAGIRRNNDMINQNPDLVIAFWDGESKGTKHTIDMAKKKNIPVEILLDSEV